MFTPQARDCQSELLPDILVFYRSHFGNCLLHICFLPPADLGLLVHLRRRVSNAYQISKFCMRIKSLIKATVFLLIVIEVEEHMMDFNIGVDSAIEIPINLEAAMGIEAQPEDRTKEHSF